MHHANEGDSLWIEYGTNPTRHILIDCGRKTAYKTAIKRFTDDPSLKLELFVLTHVDADHITGAVPLLRDARFGKSKVKDVWFNGFRHLYGKHKDFTAPGTLSSLQGEFFGAVLRDKGYPWNEKFGGNPVFIKKTGKLPEIKLTGGMKLTLLGPTMDKLEDMRQRWKDDLPASIAPGDYEAALKHLEERDNRHVPAVLSGHAETGPIDVAKLVKKDFDPDGSEPNGSSISFLAEYGGRAVLFAGDAHAPQLEKSVKRLLEQRGEEFLAIDALKMAHHGSARNNSTELLELLDCPCYLVSTNGKGHNHPDRAALARVLNLYESGVEFHFNFRSPQTKPWDAEPLKATHGYQAFYGNKGKLVVDLL